MLDLWPSTLEHWGPEHDCPRCGEPIQWLDSPRLAFPRKFEAGTYQAHRCPPSPRKLRQAFVGACGGCGEEIIRWADGEALDLLTEQPHVCQTPEPPAEPQPAVPPVGPTMPESGRSPEKPTPGVVL
jgi:hypothetical protein